MYDWDEPDFEDEPFPKKNTTISSNAIGTDLKWLDIAQFFFYALGSIAFLAYIVSHVMSHD